jgi:hypothetical protein
LLLLHIEREYRATVVGDVHSVLAVRDVDMVGLEEIRTYFQIRGGWAFGH